MDKSFYENYSFDFHNVINNNFKEKYSSIIGFFPALLRGFKKIARYSVPKKLLFIGFVLAGIFTTYSLSSIYASLDVKDKDFITSNSNYLYVDIPSIDVSKYLEYEQLDSVSHMFPIKSNIGMNLNMGFYYQTANAQATISGDLTDVADITETDLVYGRMPENEYEIVVDQFAIERMLDVSSAKQVGISKVEDVLNKKVSIDNLKDFVIVGITNKSEPVIYAAPSMFIDMAYNGRSTHNANDGDFNFDYSFEQSGGSEKNIFNYATYDKAYTLKKGRLPENDYEIIVNNSMSETMPLNKTIDQKINGNKLKVVGYYTSPENMEVYLANGNTIKYSMITEAKGFSVAPADKELAMEQLTEDGLNVVSSYEKDKTTYMESRSQSNESTIIFGVIMLAISLIEVLLMTRSSFLSRIKEIGIFRAIGVKKTDIYKMFLGEIFAITTVSSLVGVCIMSYILYHMCKITTFAKMLAINPVVFFGAIIILYVFNIIVGMIPVFNTMRKTPAAISARYDVD
jgi:ABC-type antimicrobial peptide transport system permease subunit